MSRSTVLSLMAPFTRTSLAKIRDVLVANQDQTRPDPTEEHAAVLVPLCNADPSLLAAALRETHEEVGILPGQIQVIGHFGPAELSLGALRVWPYVGFIHPRGTPTASSRYASDTHTPLTGLDLKVKDWDDGMHSHSDDDTPLPSISLSSLAISQPEVATIFHLPLTAFVSRARFKRRHFRDGRPYWAIDVSDLVPRPWESNGTREPSETNDGRLEVWGLTGWYLSVLMKLLKVYQ